MTHGMKVICPYCGARHDAASYVTAKDEPGEPRPEDGHYALCITCGCWGIYDSFAKGGLRKPRRKEAFEIVNNDAARAAEQAWIEMNRDRSKQ